MAVGENVTLHLHRRDDRRCTKNGLLSGSSEGFTRLAAPAGRKQIGASGDRIGGIRAA